MEYFRINKICKNVKNIPLWLKIIYAVRYVNQDQTDTFKMLKKMLMVLCTLFIHKNLIPF